MSRTASSEPSLGEEKFAKEYMRNGGIACKAAIAAGYSPNNAEYTGCRILKRERVQNLLESLRKEKHGEISWSRERAIKELDSLRRKAMEGEKPNLSAAVKALETIAKLADLFSAGEKESV
jgi:phage terminase small subunit